MVTVADRGALVTAVGLSGEGADLLRGILEAAADKSVLVAFGSPYVIEEYPKTQNYVCA
jgi:hypothetical protein